MPFYDWRSDDLEIEDFANFDEALLEVEANGGSVEIQRLGSDGETWTTIESFDADGAERIAVIGWKGWRIVALGAAMFRWGAY